MKRRLSCALLCIVPLALACRTATQPRASVEDNPLYVDPKAISFSDNKGTSCSDLIVIKGAKTDFQGTGAEMLWFSQHYPGFRQRTSGLGNCPNRVVDVVTIATADGDSVTVMFDITASFGKM
jgi:hypothetical protein